MDRKLISWSELKNLLDYDPSTGVFVWRVYSNGRAPVGSIAGTLQKDKYWQIGINKTLYKAHRLAWFYINGAWPDREIDHIDGNPSNNRISNLRCATRSENMQNQRNPMSTNGSGYLGVYVDKKGGAIAKIHVNGKQVYLGRFKNTEEAHSVYIKAKAELHPFTYTGTR